MASGVRSGRHWSAPAYRAATTCLMLLVAANARASTHEEVNAHQDDYRTTVISDHLVVNVDASLRQVVPPTCQIDGEIELTTLSSVTTLERSEEHTSELKSIMR